MYGLQGSNFSELQPRVQHNEGVWDLGGKGPSFTTRGQRGISSKVCWKREIVFAKNSPKCPERHFDHFQGHIKIQPRHKARPKNEDLSKVLVVGGGIYGGMLFFCFMNVQK